MLDKQQLDELAVDLINRLLKVIEEQKIVITKYEGAIEGIKLFMQEMKVKLDARDKREDSKGSDIS